MATAREEAERLVAAALAAASFASRASRRTATGRGPQPEERSPSLDDLAGLAGLAARFLGGREAPHVEPQHVEPPRADAPHHRIATGSAECCVCPVCRAIAAVRDPSPEFAERLASGASELAAGLTSILRAFGEATRRGDAQPAADLDVVAEPVPSESAEPEAWLERLPRAEDALEVDAAGDVGHDEDDSPWPGWSDFGSVWQAATRVQDDRRPAAPDRPVAKKAVAKKAVAKKAVAKKAAPAKTEPAEVATLPGGAAATKAAKKAAKKAAPAKKPVAKVAAKKAASQTAKKAVAKKAVAKRAVGRRAAPGQDASNTA